MKEQTNIPDPFGFYKQYFSMAEDSWAKVMEKTMATDLFAATMGKQIEGYLAFLDTFKKNATSYFETLPLPTEKDIQRLGGQIVALEQKIDSLDERLDVLEEKLDAILRQEK